MASHQNLDPSTLRRYAFYIRVFMEGNAKVLLMIALNRPFNPAAAPPTDADFGVGITATVSDVLALQPQCTGATWNVIRRFVVASTVPVAPTPAPAIQLPTLQCGHRSVVRGCVSTGVSAGAFVTYRMSAMQACPGYTIELNPGQGDVDLVVAAAASSNTWLSGDTADTRLSMYGTGVIESISLLPSDLAMWGTDWIIAALGYSGCNGYSGCGFAECAFEITVSSEPIPTVPSHSPTPSPAVRQPLTPAYKFM